MKSSRMVFMGALVSATMVSFAFAQSSVQQPTSVDPVSFDFGTYYAQDDAPPAVPADAVSFAAEPTCDGSTDCGCERCCREHLIKDCCPLECCDCEPWRLFPCGVGPCGGLDITGWIQAGGTIVDGNPPSNYNGPMTFNDRDELQLNELYLQMSKAADNGGCGLAWGGQIDLMYGTDHRFTMARGLETTGAFGDKWNSGGSNTYGIAMPQAYIELAYNDNLTMKIGHYYTIIGYEVVPALPNFFYSHAYTMQYGEPFTHTGFLATYDWSDTVSLVGGIDRGWDNWEDDNAQESALWGLLWDGGCGTTLALTGTFGKEFDVTGTDNTQRMLTSIVGAREITSRLTYVVQSDIGHQNSGAATASADWYGINQYLFYKINCNLTAGLRAEWFRDDDGARVTGIGATNPLVGSNFAGHFYELTMGLNWRPRGNPNLMVRPEVRYDDFDGVSTAGLALPYDDGADSKQFSGAVDVIWTY